MMKRSLWAAAVAIALVAPSAQAGTVFVNGIRADGLRDFEFSQVNVRIDASGNIWIDGPGYQVDVEGQGMAAQPAAQPVGLSPGARPQVVGAAPNQTWLVTEDHGSLGHLVNVFVNGSLVHKVLSGDDQVIIDLGPFLQSGKNAILFHAEPSTELGGGILFIHVGAGQNQSGTVELNEPDITFARRASDAGKSATQTFHLELP
jgi:hypothetical protein